MSIKTPKRLVLGVIAALVFAPFAAVAPASAGTEALTDFDAAAITTVKPATRIGVAGEFTTAFTHNAIALSGDVYTFKAALVSKPATSVVFPTLTFSTHTDTVNVVAGDFAPTAGTVSTPAKLVYTVGSDNDAIVDEILTLTSSFTPDVIGTYEVVVWYDMNDNNLIDTGETKATKSFVAVAAGAVTLTLTQFNSTAQMDIDGNGSLIRANLTNSAGAATALGALETFEASVDNSGVVFSVNGTATNGSSGLATVTLNRASFNKDGYAWLNITKAAAGVGVLTVSGSVGSAVSGITLTSSTTFAAAAGDVLTTIDKSATQLTGIKIVTAQTHDTADAHWDVDATKSTTVTFASTAAADAVVAVFVRDDSGLITGRATAAYTTYATASATGVLAFSRSFTPDDVGDHFEVGFGTNQAVNGVEVTARAAVVDAAGDVTIDGVDTTRAVVGSSVVVSAVWKNQFGIAAANQAVATSVSGRNSHVTTVNGVTDASGRITYTLTDAPQAGVTALADTITMNGPNNADDTFTINWVTSFNVSTVTLGGGNNSALGVALATPTINDIKAGAGAETGTQTITATVKDSNGSILVGIPVTWSVSNAGTKANILSTKVAATTGALGTAETSVYAWANGTYTVTATAGGVTATVTIDFRQTAGGSEERTITAAASGRVITATVIDRFGNPVPGVMIYATAPAGNAFLGAGTKSAELATNVSGQAAFVVGGTDATITVSTINPATIGGVGSGQTCAAAARISCAAAATALVAATVGTATTAETGVGNSLAPAGVATATAAVTGITPVVVVPPVVYDNPTLSFVKDGGRIILSGTAVDGEGDIIIYTKKVGTTAWKERAKTLEVAAPGDFNGSIKAPKSNVLIRVKQEGTGQFSNQIIALK